MAFPSPSTDRRPRRARTVVLLAAFAVVVAAGGARAHEAQRLTAREIVRLAGMFGDLPGGAKPVREVTVTVQGRERTLRASDWQVYALVVDQGAPVAPPPERVTLQGTRADLARIADARAEQRIAILAERRPGNAELFLLAVDLCPER